MVPVLAPPTRDRTWNPFQRQRSFGAVRLDLFETTPYRASSDPVSSSGTGEPVPPSGLGTSGWSCGVIQSGLVLPREGNRLGWRGWLVVMTVACTLLGQGEHSRVDRRFRSPSTTLQTYWESLRVGDADGAWACFVEGRREVPMPGTIWFLPSTDDLWLSGYRSLPVTAGRVMVSYEVHYRDGWSGEERMFRFGNELVRVHGEWRIAKPIGEASMPEWKPKERPVDS